MKFMEFCKSKATEIPIPCTAPGEELILDEVYETPINILIQNMKNKRDIFDVIDVPYITKIFEDDNWKETLKNKFPDGEIPDAIIYMLSRGIFKTDPPKLSLDKQAILKIFAIYICIQN